MIRELAPGTARNAILMVLGAGLGAVMVVLYPDWWPTRLFATFSFAIIGWALWRRFFSAKPDG